MLATYPFSCLVGAASVSSRAGGGHACVSPWIPQAGLGRRYATTLTQGKSDET